MALLGIKANIDGVTVALDNFRRIHRLGKRAEATTLNKVVALARTQVARAIATGAGVPFRLLRRRVQGFKVREKFVARLWVGLKRAIRKSELPRLEGKPRGQREIRIEPAARAAMEKIPAQVMRDRYPRIYRDQLARQLRRLRLRV